MSIGSLDEEKYSFFELDTDDYPDIYFEASESDESYDVSDLDEEVPFAIVNLEDLEDGDCSLDSFDDISDFDF